MRCAGRCEFFGALITRWRRCQSEYKAVLVVNQKFYYADSQCMLALGGKVLYIENGRLKHNSEILRRHLVFSLMMLEKGQQIENIQENILVGLGT